ncbi:MAG: reverse transcriptase family protein [Mariniblastus sp.]
MAKLSLANAVAIAFHSADWRSNQMAIVARKLFNKPKKKTWIASLAGRTVEQFPRRPSLVLLERFISRDLGFRQAIKTNNISSFSLRDVLGKKSVASLKWDLPAINSVQDLCDLLALTRADLDWLAKLKTRPSDGSFSPSEHYVYTWIKKRASGFRLIESPKSLLKETQRRILDEIISKIPTHDRAHGFCVDRSVVSFVQPHVKKQFCLKMDLRDFFPTIQFGRVWGLFQSVGYDSDVARCLAAICTNAIGQSTINEGTRIRGRRSQKTNLLYSRRHLPQGSPSSPSLANLIAFRLDARLAGLAEKISNSNQNSNNATNVSYTRYADDILFSADDRSIASKNFAATVGAIAIEEGFQIHYRKTKLMHCSQRQTATGVVINDVTNLARPEFDRLKAILHNCSKHGFEHENREGIPNFAEHLQGRIGWVRQLNRNKAEKLQAVFDSIE